jgi:hypothetical protein
MGKDFKPHPRDMLLVAMETGNYKRLINANGNNLFA